MNVITFKSFLVKIVIPTVIIVIALNLGLKNFKNKDPLKIIRNAKIAGKYDLAQDEYEKLIKSDFYNLEYHRGYIRCDIGPFRFGNLTTFGDESNIEKIYGNYAESEDTNISDIGNYGLGFYYTLQFENSKAESYLSKVHNQYLPFLNNTIGVNHLKSGRYDQAKEYFYKEIDYNGYLKGAFANLSRILYDNKEFDELNSLLGDHQSQKFIPVSLKRHFYFSNGDLFLYLKETMNFEYIQFPGLVSAFLISLAWFLYLRRLDIFEPEKIRYLLMVLLGGMIFSMFCGVLYDTFEYRFGFGLNGGRLNDLLFCIFGIGLIEETVKIIPFLILLKFTDEVNESVDYIIYASISALGFAFMENLLYFQDLGLSKISGRAFTAVLLHMTLTSIVAYGLFYSRYAKKYKDRSYFLIAFALACVIHGIYDYWLLCPSWPVFFPFLSFFILVFCVRKYGVMINNALNQSEFNTKRNLPLLGLTGYLVYSLSAIILMQYIIVALTFNTIVANMVFLQNILSSYILLFIILRTLGSYHIRKSVWRPFYKKKSPKASLNRPNSDRSFPAKP
jgi:RsiW-degrading membrane proteinase PrsW (M82 family)